MKNRYLKAVFSFALSACFTLSLIGTTLSASTLDMDSLIRENQPETSILSTGSQDYDFYPMPRQVTYNNGALVLKSVNLITKDLDEYTEVEANRIFTSHNLDVSKSEVVDPSKLNVEVKVFKNGNMSAYPFYDAALLNDVKKYDSYALDISEDHGIRLIAKHSDGAFYGLQTLVQILDQAQNQSLRTLTIQDYATTRVRGFIEGFYGPTWSAADIQRLMEFGSKVKMTCYIYAPKSDPYHASKWYELYPPDRLEKIRELAMIGNQKKVKYIWTMHQFQSSYNPLQHDYAKIKQQTLAKLDQLYSVGVRQFGFLADDVGGVRGNRLNYVAKIVKDINDWAQEKGDVYDLIYVPGSYAGPGSGQWFGDQELDYYEEHFPENVLVVTTGRWVCSKVTQKDVDAHRLRNRQGKVPRRDPLFWLNWPCNDVGGNIHKLFMGKGEQFIEGVEHLGGLITNPMNQAEASKVGLFTVANYSWNQNSFDADRVWAAAFRYMEPNPQASSALHELCRHMADKTFYRNEENQVVGIGESEEIKPLLQAFQSALASGDNAQINTAADALIDAFQNLEDAAKIYREQAQNPHLLREVQSFAKALEDIAVANKNFLIAEKGYVNSDKSVILNYRKGKQAMASSRSYRNSRSDNAMAHPAQKRLVPFMNTLRRDLDRKMPLFSDYYSVEPIEQNVTLESYTKTTEAMEALLDMNDISVANFTKSSTMSSGDTLIVDLGRTRLIKKAHIVMGDDSNSENAWTSYKVKSSLNKTNWTDFGNEITRDASTEVKKETLVELSEPIEARYMAIENQADSISHTLLIPSFDIGVLKCSANIVIDGNGGRISPVAEQSQGYWSGDDVRLQVLPEANHRLSYLSVNGEEVGLPAQDNIVIPHALRDVTIVARFEELPRLGTHSNQNKTLLERTGWILESNQDQGLNPGGTEGPASLMIDGNDRTIWHTRWAGIQPPARLSIQMNSPQTFDGIYYLPRQNHPKVNGRWNLIKVFVGDNPEPLVFANLNWNNVSDRKGLYIPLGSRQTSNTFRIEVYKANSADNKFYASGAELYLYKDNSVAGDNSVTPIPTPVVVTPDNSALSGLEEVWVEGEDVTVQREGMFRTDDDSAAHGGKHIWTNENNASASYTFTGKAVEVYTKSGPGAGIMDIYIDGIKVSEDDQYEAHETYDRMVFRKVFDTQGEHTIKVVRSGRKNANSRNAFMNFDAFKIYKTPMPTATNTPTPTNTPEPTVAPIKPMLNGWIKMADGNIRYYTNDVPAKGVTLIGKTTYLFDGQGNQQKGWHVINGVGMYFNPINGGRWTGLRTIGKTTYLLDAKKGKLTGWHIINGVEMYFDMQNGGRRTGLVKTDTGVYYLLSSSKGKLKGWHLINGKAMYFSPVNGARLRVK